MSIKKLLMAGFVFLFAGSLPVKGYGAEFASVKELCAASAKEFQKINLLKGYMPEELTDADYKTIQKAAEVMVENEKARQAKFNTDPNTANISKLVQTHAGRIAERAKGSKEGLIEETGHSFRFLFLSCRSCHQIYMTEAGIAP